MRSFHSDERGQVLVIVGLAFAVILLAAALAVDWGFGLTQRRVMQNAADAGAVGAGQLLVSLVLTGPTFAFTENQTFCAALDYVQSNEKNLGAIVSDPQARPSDLRLTWADASKSPFNDITAYTPFPTDGSGINCKSTGSGSLDRNGGKIFDKNARYLRVETGTTFKAFLVNQSVNARATATVFLHGTSISATGPTWPFVRHYTRAIFNESCGNPCNPDSAAPVAFWASSQNDVDYGSFMGMVDFSRFSPKLAQGGLSCNGSPPRPATCVPQLITHWDDSGPPSAPLTSTVSPQVKCTDPGGGKWITWGDDLNGGKVVDDSQCSIPNWAAKPFGNDPASDTAGRVRVDRASGVSVDPGSRRVGACAAANTPPAPLLSPSCTDPTLGDWIETNGANTANKLSDSLRAYIAANGRTDSYSSVLCTTACPGNTQPYGKYVVINVYLWDCAQTYDASTESWTTIEPKGGPPALADCTDIHKQGDISPKTIDRVHLFTFAPFRFYYGLVQSQSISGFWGGPTTDDVSGGNLNQFSNAVNLVD